MSTPCLVLFDYAPKKRKTSMEERLEYKKSRRLKKIRSLVEKLSIRVKNGKETQKQIETLLERISQQGYYPAIIDAIKNKN